MKQRNIFIVTIVCIVIITLLLATFSYIMNDIKFNSSGLYGSIDSREYNSIIARKESYDAVFLGSSMSQGFKCSELDSALGVESLKLTFPAANLAEIKFMADYAYSHRKLKYVVMDCHLLTLSVPQNLLQLPVDIYGKNYYKKRYSNAFTINSFISGTDFCKDLIKGKVKYVSRDELYDWNLKHKTGEEFFAKEFFYKKQLECNIDQSFINTACQNVEKHLLPLFEEHPETTFIVYYPPYSMMQYHDIDAEAYIQLKSQVSDLLLKFSNVQLFDFQTAHNITEDFNNYKDLTHFSGKISSFLIKEFRKNTYRMTSDNKEVFLKNQEIRLKNYKFQKEIDRMKKLYNIKKSNI